MLLVRAHLKSSEIHGLGCFAAEPIARGQRVWTFDDRIDVRVPVEELPNLPGPARDFLDMYGYEEVLDGRAYIVLAGDHAKHMNHSDAPNVLEVGNGDEIAGRDIQPGEELTCDYNAFDPKSIARFRGAGSAVPD
ncbi:MAG: SET domain-containing protein [Chloroflexi bacterium]|nr:SET domain-containing protein [Chloroflexota bacterium]